MALVFVSTHWPTVAHELPLWPTVFLVVATVLGEVKPISLPRAGRSDRGLSTSAPFVLALVGVAGVSVAILAQVIASLSDDLLHRRAFKKTAFNTAQYTLSVLAAGRNLRRAWRARTLCRTNDLRDAGDIGALLVGGLAMFAVNWVLVAGIISRVTDQKILTVLREDFGDFLVTNLVSAQHRRHRGADRGGRRVGADTARGTGRVRPPIRSVGRSSRARRDTRSAHGPRQPRAAPV